MNRKIKNIIMISILGVLVTLLGLTIYLNKGEKIKNVEMPPTMNSNNSSESMAPLDKPSDSSSKSSSEPPEKPDSNSNNGSNEMQGGMEGEMSLPEKPEKNQSVSYYVVLILLSLSISIIIIYLIMSRFNKKTFKETLSSSDKKIA